jgi:hypothetical protein
MDNITGKNLSYETKCGIESKGYYLVQSEFIKGDSYVNIFFNYDYRIVLTLVNSPREIKGVWIGVVFDHLYQRHFYLENVEGINLDDRGRAIFHKEEDILPFIDRVHETIRTKGR